MVDSISSLESKAQPNKKVLAWWLTPTNGVSDQNKIFHFIEIYYTISDNN